jgi:quercetin dioxygenase-like cupin family protein
VTGDRRRESSACGDSSGREGFMDYKVDFEQMDWESPVAGIRHKVKQAGGLKLRLVEYSTEMEPHWCSRGHTGIILRGDFEIEFDGEKHVFRPGDGVMIPSGEEHRHRARVLKDVVRAVFVEEI